MPGSQYFHINVMSPAASAGEYQLSLESLDAAENISIILQATGLSTSDDESQLARVIGSQFNTQLQQYGVDYTGIPWMPGDALQATYSLSRSDHVLTLWSQAQFEIREVFNDTGARIRLSEDPIFMTLADAKARAIYNGVTFVISGAALTDDQIIDLIEQSSGELVNYLRNRIVLSTYLFEGRGKDTKSIKLKPSPILFFDLPRIRRKNPFRRLFSLIEPVYQERSYNAMSTGELNFVRSENYPAVIEPFDLDNVIRVTYVAGLSHISGDIKKAVLQLSAVTLFGAEFGGNLTSLAGGSFKVSFGDFKNQLFKILSPLKIYKA